MNRIKAIWNGVIYTGHSILWNKAILIDADRILDVIDEELIPENVERIDADGAYICPGLIDLQVYGTGEDLFSADLTSTSLLTIEKNLLKQGCTTFYLTLATNTLEVFQEAIRIFKNTDSSVAAGLHLEGPFLNTLKRGAHPHELIKKADVGLLQNLLDDAQGAVKMMTVAVELFDKECIGYLLEKNILISAGHSVATLNEAFAGFDSGVQAVTHLWNAMSPLHHREVGLPGAAYNHPSVQASIIVDGIHVDYEAVKISKAIMKERLFLITDAVAACQKGIYQHILQEDHYVLPDGTLSGSALTMLRAIENCVNHVGIALDEAIRMATLYPAQLARMDDIGKLEKGMFANILIFDKAFNVKEVYFRGEKISL